MRKVRVKNDFADGGRMFRKGEVLDVTEVTAAHLVKTGQAEFETYPMGVRKKQAKQPEKRVTKDVKSAPETKDAIEDLRKKYEEKFGEKPDLRWSESSLRKRIEK